MRMTSSPWAALAAAAALLVPLAPRGARAQEPLGIALGDTAPSATVQTLDGKSVDLRQFVGKTPVVLEFWATWCGNCKELEPQMLSVAKQYAGKVRFVTVAVSVNQSPARVKAYAAKYGYHTADVVYDTHGDAVTAYDAPATSYIVVLDKAGKVVYTGLGPEQDIAKAVAKATG